MARKVANFYDAIAAVYPVLDLFLHKPKKVLLSRINQEPAGSLLEIGVGRGDNLPHYKHGPITGIDVSEGMLAYARAKAPQGCTLRIMDAGDLDFPDNTFAYCVLSYVLSVVESPEKVMNEVFRVLEPGGKVYILNHESTGPLSAVLSKGLAPLVSRIMHFSAVFDMDPLVDPEKFEKLRKDRCRLFPSITMLVLRKKEGTAAG